MRSNIPALTSLRFFAAGVVVLTHLIKDEALSATWYGHILMAGPQAVIFFFALSGFIMTYVYHGQDEANPVIDSAKFWKARFARIYPAYILALVIAMPNVLYMAYVSKILSVEYLWISTTLSAVMLQGWVPEYNGLPNGAGWSLTVEMMFYALFPALLIFTSKLDRWSFAAFAVALLVLTYVLKGELVKPEGVSDDDWKMGYLYKLPLNYIGTFCAGMAAGRIYLFGPRLSVATHDVMFVCGSALLLAFTAACDLNDALKYDQVIIVPITCFVVYAGANVSFRTLSWKPLVVLGEASYALYILHGPIITNLMYVFRVFHWREHGIVFGIIGGFATVLLSVLCFVYFERPMRAKIISWL